MEIKSGLVISNKTDRELRFIEVKWLSRELTTKELTQNIEKTMVRANSYAKHMGHASYVRSYFVAVNRTRLTSNDQLIRLLDLVD